MIEEFEHLSLAMEDEDREAIAYFKAQRRLRLQAESNEELALNPDTLKKEEDKGIFSVD